MKMGVAKADKHRLDEIKSISLMYRFYVTKYTYIFHLSMPLLCMHWLLLKVIILAII